MGVLWSVHAAASSASTASSRAACAEDRAGGPAGRIRRRPARRPSGPGPGRGRPGPGRTRRPLLAGLVEVGGDEVRGVRVAAAGHPTYAGGRGGVLGQHEVRVGGGVALDAVHGGRVASSTCRADVVGGQLRAGRAGVVDGERPSAVRPVTVQVSGSRRRGRGRCGGSRHVADADPQPVGAMVTRRSSTAPAATSRSRIAALSRGGVSRVSTTTARVPPLGAASPARCRQRRRAAAASAAVDARSGRGRAARRTPRRGRRRRASPGSAARTRCRRR